MNPEMQNIIEHMEKMAPPIQVPTPFLPEAAHPYLTLNMARLMVLVAEEASKSSEKMTRQTDRLITGVGDLVLIAEDQKKLAAKLEQQTNSLIRLSWALVILSVVLLAVALAQTKMMSKENPGTHVEHIQRGQGNTVPAPNK